MSKLRDASKSRVAKRKRSDSNVVSISRDRSKSVAGRIMERDRSVLGLGQNDAKETVIIFKSRKRQKLIRSRRCTRRFPILWQKEVRLIAMCSPRCQNICLVVSGPTDLQTIDNIYAISIFTIFSIMYVSPFNMGQQNLKTIESKSNLK